MEESHLRQHVKFHRTERPVACGPDGKKVAGEECHEPFTARDGPRKHMEVHAGESRFPCGECGTLFMEQSHLRQYTGGRRRSCEECDKPHPGTNNRGRHMRVHARESQFPCGECSTLVTEQSHLRQHTGGRQQSCEECDKPCPGTDNLERHMKVQAGREPSHYDHCTKTTAPKDVQKCTPERNHAIGTSSLVESQLQKLTVRKSI